MCSNVSGDRDGVGAAAYPWPKDEPLRTTFQHTMCAYYRHMSALGRGVVEAVLTALGLAPDLPLVRELFDHIPLPVGEWCVGAYYTS